ncbi:MAG: site-specific integrase [Lachnospiraceae bacterium]|nr:site-specific integrase [Lachnospiraceae bacterium]
MKCRTDIIKGKWYRFFMFTPTPNLIALQSMVSSGNLDTEDTNSVLKMIRKEKEKQVLQSHKYKISGPFKTGKQVYFTTRCPWLPSKKLNRNNYNDIIDELYEHYYGSTNDRITVREVYERMIKDYEDNNKKNHLTLVHYKADWDKYVVGKGAKWLDKPIAGVLSSQVFEFYSDLTANEAMLKSTFTNVKTVINAVFDYAINNDIPCIKASEVSIKTLKFAQKDDKWKDVYTYEDKKKILSVCEQTKPTVYTKAVELMFCLDIRIGELRALRKEDVNMDARTIYIGHQMVDRQTDTANRHPVRVNIMKGGKEAGKRYIPLSDRAIGIIRWLNDHYSYSVWLLPNKTGKGPIYTNRFNENLERLCKKAGVKYFSSHGIRFHNISALYDAGVEGGEIQRISGHTSERTTMSYKRKVSNTCEDDKIRAVLG